MKSTARIILIVQMNSTYEHPIYELLRHEAMKNSWENSLATRILFIYM